MHNDAYGGMLIWLTLVNAQQLPHFPVKLNKRKCIIEILRRTNKPNVPWFLTAETLFDDLQSNESGGVALTYLSWGTDRVESSSLNSGFKPWWVRWNSSGSSSANSFIARSITLKLCVSETMCIDFLMKSHLTCIALPRFEIFCYVHPHVLRFFQIWPSPLPHFRPIYTLFYIVSVFLGSANLNNVIMIKLSALIPWRTPSLVWRPAKFPETFPLRGELLGCWIYPLLTQFIW